jgi:glucose/arabinose dehydrogenase
LRTLSGIADCGLRIAGAVLLALLVVPSVAVAHKAHCEAPPPTDLEGDGLRFVPLVQGLAEPVYVTGAPGTDRLFVVERSGRVRVVRGGRALRRPFLDLSDEIAPTVDTDKNERGMATVAFRPDYRRSGRFYVFYSDARGDVRVDEFRRSPRDPDRALRSSRRNILHVRHDFEQLHYAGQLAFGPDRLLYVSLGDADLPDHAQLRDRLRGKVLQLDPRHPRRDPRVFALGLRNPHRFSFDRLTRDFLLGDVGEDDYDEIDFLPAGSKAGANFGWPVYEGPERVADGTIRGYRPPALSLAHPFATAVVGGYVVRNRELSGYWGRYLYGDFCDGWVASAVIGEEPADNRLEGVTVPYLVSFGEDRKGRIYGVSTIGVLYRVLPS